jgi:hypothetical protein
MCDVFAGASIAPQGPMLDKSNGQYNPLTPAAYFLIYINRIEWVKTVSKRGPVSSASLSDGTFCATGHSPIPFLLANPA